MTIATKPLTAQPANTSALFFHAPIFLFLRPTSFLTSTPFFSTLYTLVTSLIYLPPKSKSDMRMIGRCTGVFEAIGDGKARAGM